MFYVFIVEQMEEDKARMNWPLSDLTWPDLTYFLHSIERPIAIDINYVARDNMLLQWPNIVIYWFISC